MTFEELCAQPLGSADYLAIAETFNTVIISGIPEMGPEKRNEAKRFTTLIDALYDGSAEKFVSTEVIFEDGRKGVIEANVRIADAETFPPAQAAALSEAAE